MKTSFKTDYSGKKTLTLLKRKLLVDGFHLVIDIPKSKGSYVFNQVDQKKYLSFYSFFASLPVGFNHPGLKNKDYLKALHESASLKVALSDVYSPHFARFVDVLNRTALRDQFQHLFFVEGGGLAVENALKVAFDWKTRFNFKKGRKTEANQVIHFKECFHGRTGYTLSLTDSFDTRKTDYFPKFKWPRIDNPKINVYEEGPLNLPIQEREAKAVQQINYHLNRHEAETAAIIIEPIQGEGGDNHFRPQFLRMLRKIANKKNVLLVFDEIQTGLGLTGEWWAWEHFGVKPDIMVFGKKTQVCGIAATERVDKKGIQNCFKVSSRINSTFGGNLTDMVRATRYIEIIRECGLLKNIVRQGNLCCKELQKLSFKFPLTNIRGLGGLIAFDLPSTTLRNQTIKTAMEDFQMIILPSGKRAIRFRPVLSVTASEIIEGIKRLEKTLKKIFL